MTDFLVARDDLVISVDFVKVMHSHHSHQLPPRLCGRQWRVMRATEGERFFLSYLWRLGFCSEFNAWWWRSTQCGHVARADWRRWWHDPWVSCYFLVSLDFWFQNFSFSFALIFALSVIFLAYFCDYSDSAPATPTLLRRRFFPNFSGFDHFALQGTLLFYSPSVPFS